MEIINTEIYKGRNIFSHNPIIKMVVDIDKYNEIPTKDIEGFNEKLLNCFPGLKKDTCGLGYEGGFLQRLTEGTYLAHVLEHVILNIQNTLGYKVKYGKTRMINESSKYHVIYEYENEIFALECGKVAIFIMNHFILGKNIEISQFLEYLMKVKLDTELGPSTAAIANEAKKRNIPVTRIGYESLIRLGHGKQSKMLEATLSDETSCISADISSNKQLTKLILDEHQIPVPYGKVVYTEISAVMAAKQIGFPVVVKPFNGNQGKGVQTNLKNETEVRNAFMEALKYGSGIIVEKYMFGNDYRILVVGGEVKAVAQRLPAMIIGDGIHSITELVEILNREPERGESHEKSLTKIDLGEVEKSVLRKNEMDENTVPKAGERIILRENGNISTGGTAIDCTDLIHPDNVDIAVNAANVIGIDIAGIDMVAEDISKSILSSEGAVIEVNCAPGIRMHLYPSEGEARNVAKDIVDFLFPNDSYDFPIVSVTGTNGKTTTVRLISHILTQSGRTVGITSTSGTFHGDKCISKGDNSGPRSARTLLANKQIDAAVVETARGGIIREGLGYDLADVGIVTNVTEDHLGLDDVDTLEDLAYVKALVVEAVKPNGFSVLNAEDAMTASILKTVQTDTILFFKNRDNMKVENKEQYINVYIEEDFIKIQDRKKVLEVINIKEIPITQSGLLECNIDNCLAAVAASYALDIKIEVIKNGLASFCNNAGRFQIIEMENYKIMLDYAHNPAGYKEVVKICKKIPCKRRIGIIGMPGDRPDDSIKDVGALAAEAFDVIYIKEDTDLRNRQKDEVATLLYDAILNNGFDRKKINLAENEVEALKQAMEVTEKDDFIIILYEKIEPLMELINKI